MFEAAEVGREVSKAAYKAKVPALRSQLLDAQQDLRRDPCVPVIVLFAGVDTAGKGETINLLNEWMDPRWLLTRAYGPKSAEERARPRFWRYWRDLPPRGRIGLFLSAWYSSPVLDRVRRQTSGDEFDGQLEEIATFEKALTDDGAVIVKFWMHLDKASQRKRLRSLEKDPLTRWRVTKEQWKNWEMYGRFIAAAERAIRHTSTGQAPWHIIEGRDERYRGLSVGVTIRDAIREALARHGKPPVPAETAPAITTGRETAKSLTGRGKRSRAGDTAPRVDAVSQVLERVARQHSVLDTVNLSLALDKKAFLVKLETYQGRLNELQRKALSRGISTIAVFEGWDAAGKGGAIRRVTAALDARWYQVIPIAAPTDEERAQHYLWRFWRHLARNRVTVFDRSWYGRVLVERVEGFASRAEWMRAYSEINHFEEQLVHGGICVVKYWVHISQEEQHRRFKEREKLLHKRWKITQEDWRNRQRWGDYELAVNDMVARTSTSIAPWTIVEGNDKNYARIKVLDVLCDRLEKRLKKAD